MRFNVNDKVRVKLTPVGCQILRAEHDAVCDQLGVQHPYTPPVKDKDGWSEFQLWDLMSRFGPHMYNGAPPPFATEIEIPE